MFVFRRNKIIAVAGTGVILGSTLLYAKYDEGFRKDLSEYLPFINSLLGEDTKLPLATPVDDSFMKKRNVQSSVASPQASSGKVPDIAKQVPVPIEKPKESKAPEVPKQEQKKSTPELVAKTEKVEDDLSDDGIRKQVTATLDEIVNKKENTATQLGNKDYESEVRTQLKRQLYVVNDYFQEQIILHKTELNRRSEMELKDKVRAEKEAVANMYEQSFRKLKQMESLLESKFSGDFF